jgi:hypothetical protein
VGRGRSRAVRGAYTRVVLRTAPREADAGVSDRITLHLIDGHLGGVTVDELNEAAALSRRDLDVGDLSESLEERPKLILGDVATKATDEDGCVVGIRELVHGLHGGIGSRLLVVEAHGSTPAHVTGSSGTSNLGNHLSGSSSMTRATVLVVGTGLGSGGRNAHGTVAAKDTLHLHEGTLLILLVGETNEAVATRLSGHGVGHNLSRLARREATLEERHQNELVNLGAEIANEDGILRATVITTIDKTTATGPVELENPVRVGDRLAVEAQSTGSSLGSGELDEAVAGIARVAVTDDLDLDGLVEDGLIDLFDKVLVHPRLHLTHPQGLAVTLGIGTDTGGKAVIAAVGWHVARATSGNVVRHGVRLGRCLRAVGNR